MKRVMTLILLVCLMLAFSAMAESNPDDSLSTETRYAAVKALLTGNPEVTPEQAQITLEFLSIVHTKLGDAFRKENREKAADAVSLLLYIEEKDPEIYSRVMAAVPEGIADTKPSAYILNIPSTGPSVPGLPTCPIKIA